MASLILISYKSTDTVRSDRSEEPISGRTTAPMVMESPVSSFRSRLPLIRVGTPVPLTCQVPMSVAGIPCRSEEHTSDLQSLMRISYAVLRLKKKNTQHKL